ncbi:LysE family translocator [Kaistia sp. UC242_56]|uniref:LysE family translocator n=1 Tax=Kaistia sp. UC242_56 TaxID=3374625 RepID=UPI0037958510
MTAVPTFILAVLALLAVPGPTNTLLATSGAAIGMRRSLRLVPAELAGYGLAIGILMGIVGPLAAEHPIVPILSKIVASLYLAGSAVALWRQAAREALPGGAPISVRRVFVTTLLNPKALIFAFLIFPRDLASLPGFAGLFSVLVVGVACGWITLGSSLSRSAGGFATPARVSRFAAVALVVFASVMASSAIAAALS